MRTNELMRAAKELGLKEVFFLGYRNSVDGTINETRF